MNPDYEKKLEQEVDGLLKDLPNLTAPDGLLQRVMSRTAGRAKVAWYHQSWEMWPAGIRYAALAVLLGSFAGLCFASWRLTSAAGVSTAMEEVGRVFSGITVIWNVVSAVFASLILAIKHLHPAIVAGSLAVLALAWSACVGLGTAFVRFAVVRR